jgi:hypothetical protein
MIHEFAPNYNALYDLQLGRRASRPLPAFTFEQVVLPEYGPKVIGIRGRDDMRMSQQDPTLVLDLDRPPLKRSGTKSCSILTPVAVSTLPGNRPRFILPAHPFDVGKVFIRGETSGQEVWEEIRLNGTTTVTTAKICKEPAEGCQRHHRQGTSRSMAIC